MGIAAEAAVPSFGATFVAQSTFVIECGLSDAALVKGGRGVAIHLILFVSGCSEPVPTVPSLAPPDPDLHYIDTLNRQEVALS